MCFFLFKRTVGNDPTFNRVSFAKQRRGLALLQSVNQTDVLATSSREMVALSGVNKIKSMNEAYI
ncbi:hypothetical protein [Lactococcus lactis]|uniref:Uncharacterized protein n=1 Tax=Lactococcus lactis TaxID=1358 RepID=A0AAP3Z369_9LACT|nr:hypothetical protein [Lactococcus lactis]MDG4977453.1 hypothetical protein [Lactococcus lactis]